MNLARKAKAIAATSALSGSLFAANAANAEPNQPLPEPPRQGLGGHMRGDWGITNRPLGDIKNDVKNGVANGVTSGEIHNAQEALDVAKKTDLTEKLPQGPNDHLRLGLTFRRDFLAAAAAIKLEDTGISPLRLKEPRLAELNLSFIMRDDSNGTGFTGSLGLLDNINRTALSRFQVQGQPMNLLTDKAFNDQMTLSDQLGARLSGRNAVADSKSVFVNYDAAIANKVTDSHGDAGYSPLPSQAASASLEAKAGTFSASLGGGLARLSLPDNSGAEYRVTATAMAGVGNDTSHLTAIGEYTKIVPGQSPGRDHLVLGAVGKVGVKAWGTEVFNVFAAGAYAVDQERTPNHTSAVKTASGELGAGIGPRLVNVYGSVGGGKSTSADASRDKWFISAHAGLRVSY